MSRYDMRSLVVGVVGALLLLSAPRSSFAYSYLQTPDGTPLKWATVPIPYQIGELSPDIPEEDQIEAIFQAAEAWEAIPEAGLKFEFVGYTDVGTPNGSDGINSLYFQQKDWDPASNAIGTTHSYAVESGTMTGFDMRFNDQKYTFSTTDDPDEMATDLQNSVTHEFGHVLGLSHSADPEATMYAVTSSGDVAKRDLAVDDINGILFLYANGLTYEEGDVAPSCACTSSTLPGAEKKGGAAAALLLLGALFNVGRLYRRRS